MSVRILSLSVCVWWFVGISSVWAVQKDQKTAEALRMAREALALGEMERWEQALKKLEQSFLIEKDQIDPEKRNMYQLWVWMMWSKFYQYKGKFPPVRNVKSFESPQQMNAYTQLYSDATSSLERAYLYLKRYNLLYQQIADRSNLRSQLQLSSSLSLERDLEGAVRSARIYIALLKFAKQTQKNIKELENRLFKSRKDLSKLKSFQEDSSKSQRQIKREQRKLSSIFKRVEGAYLKFESSRLGRIASSRALAISGGVLMGLGLLGLVGGVVVYLDAGRVVQAPTSLWFAPSGGICSVSGADPKSCSDGSAWKERLESTSYGLFGGGGGLLLIGGILLTVGLVGAPSKVEKSKSVLRSQDVYLRTLKPDGEDKTSSLRRRRGGQAACTTLLEVR